MSNQSLVDPVNVLDGSETKVEPAETAYYKNHKPLSAYDRDEKSPVWDMSQERVFIETLLNQRFNYLIVFFSVVIAGAINTGNELHFKIILTIGALVSYLLFSSLQRSKVKLDLIIEDLKSDPSHPVKVIDFLANDKARERDFFELFAFARLSKRHIIDTIIPFGIFVVLALGASLAWLELLNF